MSLYSGRATLALSRIKRILAQNGVEFQLNAEWTLEELNSLCEGIDDLDLYRQLAIVQSETGQIVAA
ncbi:hypothetical protein GP5015_124 [gamma proteobacterium HTCC5015]|nr:hypothetical protein GP5015_124 [gamma proteobacterium HTCC5015]